MTTSSFDSTLANLGINTTASAAASSAAAANATTNPSGTLDQADFLQLMTAQLQNQDPFNPVDNTQMVAQMAQFSSVAGISQMNTTLSSIAAKLGATSPTDAMSYVGKTVLTEGSVAYGRTSGGIAGAVGLDGDASDVTVQIADQNGNVLKTMDLGAQSKGTVSYDWDGTTDAGTTAPAGPYQVAVSANENGLSVGSHSLVWAPVESVSMPSSGDPVLSVTGVGPVDLSDVYAVG
jgi:flagellar basal-body rod modification protein FlgD